MNLYYWTIQCTAGIILFMHDWSSTDTCTSFTFSGAKVVDTMHFGFLRVLHSGIQGIRSLVHNVVLLRLNSALISPIVAHIMKMDGHSCSEDELLELFQHLEHSSSIKSVPT